MDDTPVLQSIYRKTQGKPSHLSCSSLCRSLSLTFCLQCWTCAVPPLPIGSQLSLGTVRKALRELLISPCPAAEQRHQGTAITRAAWRKKYCLWRTLKMGWDNKRTVWEGNHHSADSTEGGSKKSLGCIMNEKDKPSHKWVLISLSTGQSVLCCTLCKRSIPQRRSPPHPGHSCCCV